MTGVGRGVRGWPRAARGGPLQGIEGTSPLYQPRDRARSGGRRVCWYEALRPVSHANRRFA